MDLPRRLDANWVRCGLPPTDFNARDMGGDSRRSAALVVNMAEIKRSTVRH